MKAGTGWSFSPALGAFLSSHTTASMPAIQSSYLALSSNAQFATECAISVRTFNHHHHSYSRQCQGYEPYPTAEEVFLHSNSLDPDEGFGNIYLMDFIHAHKQVGR